MLLILTVNESTDVALGSTDFGIGSNPDLYVIQNFEAMSSKNPGGHPFSSGSSSPPAADGVSGAFADGFDTDGGLCVEDEACTASDASPVSGASLPTGLVAFSTVLELARLEPSSL